MLSVSRRAHSSVVGLFTAALPWPFTAFRLPFLGLSLLFDCLSLTFHCLSQVVVCAGVKSILDVPRTLECEGHCLSVVLPPPFCRASTAFLSCFHRLSVVLPPLFCRASTAFMSRSHRLPVVPHLADSASPRGVLPRYLESAGVAVIGYKTDRFPAFFTVDAGVPAPLRLDSPEQVAAWLTAQQGQPPAARDACPGSATAAAC